MNRANPFIILSLLVMTCLSGLVPYAQQPQSKSKPDQYRAVHWDKEDGLAINNGNVMIKDADGFLWVGNGGGGSPIYRFDGAVFKKYTPDANKNGSINSGAIHTFEEDSLHNIWIGTERGLSRYDIKADTFSNFAPLTDSAYDNGTIAPFWATRNEVYCMEPGAWITAIDIRTFTRKKLVKISSDVNVYIPHWNANKSFFDSASNSFWALASYDGLQENGLVQIFLNGHVNKHPWPCYRKNIIHRRHGAEDMMYDKKRNSIWINSGDGLLEFSLHDKQFHPIAAMNDLVERKDYDRGVGIDIDPKNRIIFSTWLNGILIYDPQSEQIESLFSDSLLQKKVGESNLHIYFDPDGIAWISNWSEGGVYQLQPINPVFTRYYAKPTIKDSLSNEMISTILQGPEKKIWIGTGDGLNIFDPASEKFEVLKQEDLPGLKGTAIIPVFIDTGRQVAWLNAGSQESNESYFNMTMYEMDLKTRKCSSIIFRDGVKTIDTFLVSHALVRPYHDGIIFCDEYHGIFEVKKGSRVANLMIPFKRGFGGMTLAENKYLFLQGGGPLPNYSFENRNGKWTKIPHLLDSTSWTYMLYNSRDQTYWVCIRDEILHLNNDFQKIRSYSSDIWEIDLITNLLFDNSGNLWFVNYANQIGRLDPVTGTITAFGEIDGYQKQDYGWFAPATKGAAGDIYFGIGWKPGVTKPGWGFDRSHPERFLQVRASRVYIDALSINQKLFPSHYANGLEEFILRYNQNNISIETGIIDYYSRGKSRLRYKLVENGKEADWQYGPSHFTLHYEGLPPGNYKLVMQASNINYEFSGPEKILAFKINAPFWQRVWFQVLAAILAILLLYGFVRYRSRNLRKRNAQLEEKVLTRTKELKLSLEELRDTQTQLIQREKMASLGELTAGIAHEIQNPLNFVNNFSEVNREMLEEMKSEIDKGNLDEVKAIADDLIENENKIINHGKRADSIVKGMLQHSRASTGIKEPADVNALVDEYLRLSYHGLRAKDKSFNAKIETNFDAQLGKLNIVPQDIGRVMLNIFNNAFYSVNEKKKKAGESFEALVSVKTSLIPSSPGEGGKAMIRVHDNGLGIPQKIVDKIYQPFFTTKPTGEGTGLGLSLSYDIVTKLHGGELRVESKEGEFAEFIIVLPLGNG